MVHIAGLSSQAFGVSVTKKRNNIFKMFLIFWATGVPTVWSIHNILGIYPGKKLMDESPQDVRLESPGSIHNDANKKSDHYQICCCSNHTV